jgi:hypothetical protein
MKANTLRLIGAAVVACAVGCDGTGTDAVHSAPAAIVTVSPSNAVVPPSNSTDFSATVTTDSIGISDSVHWGVAGTGCTGNACGTVTSLSAQSARFVAPAVAPVPSTVAVVATSDSDAESFGISYVTIGTTPIAVTIAPTSAGVTNCGRADFIATVANDSAGAGVTWSLEGGLCDAGPCGAVFPDVTASGAGATYAGPCSSTLPFVASVTVRATSISDPSRSATATVTVTQ